MPAIFWGVVFYRLAKKSMQKKPASFTTAIPVKEDPVERWYTCPKCGQLVREGEDCDCEAFSASRRLVTQTQEPVYMLEDKDGFFVRVPHSKVAAWKKAQMDPGYSLNNAECQSAARAASMIYPSQVSQKAERKKFVSFFPCLFRKLNKTNITFACIVVFLALFLFFDFKSSSQSTPPSSSHDSGLSSHGTTENKPFNIRKKEDTPDPKSTDGRVTITQIETGKTWTSGSDPDVGLSAVPIHNGEIIIEPSEEGLAPLTIETRGTEKYYVPLKPLGYEGSEMSFYVIGGQTAEVLVPLGYYELYYATGNTWYGLENLFGSKTERFKCDDTFDFYEEDNYYQGWTVTLYKVSNGNMSTKAVSEEDFPI